MIESLEITSRLGGNCRLRLHAPLQAREAVELRRPDPQSANPNPFFAAPALDKPRISPSAAPREVALADSELIEFSTGAGKTYRFQAAGGSWLLSDKRPTGLPACTSVRPGISHRKLDLARPFAPGLSGFYQEDK